VGAGKEEDKAMRTIKRVKCGLCKKYHNYYLKVEGKKIASAVCKGCEKYLNKNVVKTINKIVNNKGEVNLFAIVGVVYLVVLLIVLLTIF